MKEKMNYEHMTAPCGLDCFNCQLFIAKDDPEKRAMIAKQLQLPEEKVSCAGCREVKGNCPAVPFDCHVYPCAEKKGVQFCYECSDFPCDHLQPYADMADKVPHNTKVFNLCLIKKMGVEAWAKNKAADVRKEYFQGKWKL